MKTKTVTLMSGKKKKKRNGGEKSEEGGIYACFGNDRSEVLWKEL